MRIRGSCGLLLLAAVQIECASEGSMISNSEILAPASKPHESYDIHADDRVACAFRAGASTAETLGDGPDVPQPASAGLKHVVILMQENRSFDHVLGGLTELSDDPMAGVKAGVVNGAKNP